MGSVITTKPFAKLQDGKDVTEFIFKDQKGQTASILDYGVTIRILEVFGNDGKLYDVALGYDDIESYVGCTAYFGTTVGRVANRIANGEFTLNGVDYKLFQNDGINTLHGGKYGFCKKVFDAKIDGNAVVFSYLSADMEEGFPGNLSLTITTTFEDGKLLFDYEFVSDKDTIVGLTNHNYFNLNGHKSHDVLNHTVTLEADEYCECNDGLLSQCPAADVTNTPFDFRSGKTIDEGLSEKGNVQLELAGGIDHNFVMNNENNQAPKAISVGDVTGIELKVYSDLPGMQFYTGNFLGSNGDVAGKDGALYQKHGGFCLEAQQFPNAINEPGFPQNVVKANEKGTCFIAYELTVS